MSTESLPLKQIWKSSSETNKEYFLVCFAFSKYTSLIIKFENIPFNWKSNSKEMKNIFSIHETICRFLKWKNMKIFALPWLSPSKWILSLFDRWISWTKEYVCSQWLSNVSNHMSFLSEYLNMSKKWSMHVVFP